MVSEEKAKQVERAIDSDDWVRARKLIISELRREPDNVWYLDRLSLTYYEQHKYKKSLEVIDKAFALAPNDQLVMWDRAGSLDMLGRESEAIALFKKILRKGVEGVAYGKGGEGLPWARELVNDSRYRIGICYADLGRLSLAVRYLKQHLSHRGPGTRSIYNKRQVKKELRDLEEKRSRKVVRRIGTDQSGATRKRRDGRR